MFLSFSDIRTGVIALLIIILALVVTEWLARRKILPVEISRKILHVTAIATCAWVISTFENRLLLAFVFLLFTVLLWWVTRKNWLSTNNIRSYGIAFFPAAFALLLFIKGIPQEIIAYAALTLAVCDAAAGLAGHYLAPRKMRVLFEEKSWMGFFAFWCSNTILSYFFFNLVSSEAWLFLAAIALLPALTELFSYKGSDNFTVPVITALWICLLLQLPVTVPGEHEAYFDIFGRGSVSELYATIVMMAALSLFAVYKKWLTIDGAAAACWMGLLILVTCGPRGFIAPGLFLVCGSLLSKLNKRSTDRNGRTAIQVFANGIVGVICMLVYALFYQPEFLYASLASFCVGICDSVSSEAGGYWKGRTVDILSFKKVSPGLSGGISWPGTLAGMAGAALLAGVTS
ncbi:MAG: DUF92 domain-containing protein, partial [Dinghuibacter sp.]|nr:DUF92 domain-containing protein [Dinghuibacter sp.]